MYADAVVTVVLRAESDPMPQKSGFFVSIFDVNSRLSLFVLSILNFRLENKKLFRPMLRILMKSLMKIDQSWNNLGM